MRATVALAALDSCLHLNDVVVHQRSVEHRLLQFRVASMVLASLLGLVHLGVHLRRFVVGHASLEVNARRLLRLYYAVARLEVVHARVH